ncbi:alpha/beta hydrolase [Pseudonocardia spinosispora]|uniref:alpha/beta hydrolase n=1 Tax=Pseudonocardia spinosispora TaxID=103441 RepID=UPI0003F7EFA5|nr:alpha/beta hydrolase-fold protein [Pseudonocardia spinosispora]
MWRVGRAGFVAMALAVVMTLVAAPGFVRYAMADEPDRPSVAGLPAPFRDWDVRLTPRADNPRVLDLVFTSPALHRRITNRVYLPGGYRTDGPRWPVMYYLHGSDLPALDNETLRPVTRQEYLANDISAGGGAVQTDLFDFDKAADRARFLVVSPDTSPHEAICETCFWFDGRPPATPTAHPVTAVPLAADTYLHHDLYPLVEALFHARSDRGGRGVMGFSMGAMAAYQQGMMHPDQYAVVSSVSGVLDLVNDPEMIAVLDGVGYYRDQGYGTSVTDKPEWRGRNPLDLATNLAGVDTEVLSTSGDVCLRPTSVLAPECVRYPPARNPAAAWAESIMYRQYLEHANRLRQLGVHETHYLYPGVHGSYNSRMYAERLLPLADSVFDRHVADPKVFSSRSVLDHFSVWGYDVTVRRPGPEFLDMTGARGDGTEFTLRGSGVAQLSTPASFHPDQTYRVAATRAGGTVSVRQVRAGHDGRLLIRVDLGRAALLDQLTNQVKPSGTDLSTATPVTVRVTTG